jgi:hypothetical protein
MVIIGCHKAISKTNSEKAVVCVPRMVFNLKYSGVMAKKMTFKQVRNLFFEEFPEFKSERKSRKPQNEYSTNCRVYWCDFVEMLRRNGNITESQANRIVLG